MDRGTIAVIGIDRVVKMNFPPGFARNMDNLSSECIVLDPFNRLTLEKISGRVFSGVIIAPGSTEGRYFNEIYSLVKLRLKA